MPLSSRWLAVGPTIALTTLSAHNVTALTTPVLASHPVTAMPGAQTTAPTLFAQASDLPPNLPSVPSSTLDDTLPDRPSDPTDLAPASDNVSPPTINLPTPSAPPESTPVPETSFFIETINVVGSTVLTEEIAEQVARYEQKNVTFSDLLTLRSDLTQLYIQNGYITSGVFLPSNQVLTDGTVTLQVVEGAVEDITVIGLRHLRDSYVRDRLSLSTTTPLNQQALEERLQLLQLDPFITRINAELTAGSTPGRNRLQVDIDEPSPWLASIGTNNYRSPSIGSTEVSTTVGRNNLVGIGDRLSATYGLTEGLNIWDVDVSVPVNPREGTVSFGFNSSNSEIITDEFEELEIESETRSYSLNFRQPLMRSPNEEFALGVGLDLRRRQTFILGDEPFSFSEGAEDGETNATVLRFSQDWLKRSPNRVLAARSQFSIGLDAFNATVNDTGTDARFFSWIGQFQWVQQLSQRNLIIGRISTQLTPDSLLSLEQFSIGGVDTVRGYSQNELVADNGVLASVEMRIPLTKNPQRFQLAPFIDAGTVWNNRTPDPEETTLVGVGLGLRWLIRPDFVAELDYGIPLISVDDDSDSLQADGLYFSLRYQPF